MFICNSFSRLAHRIQLTHTAWGHTGVPRRYGVQEHNHTVCRLGSRVS